MRGHPLPRGQTDQQQVEPQAQQRLEVQARQSVRLGVLGNAGLNERSEQRHADVQPPEVLLAPALYQPARLATEHSPNLSESRAALLEKMFMQSDGPLLLAIRLD
ncbi:hypothetical protein GCM10008959_19750 [Deinococcus seoulensis]|uniref:Uncharacterized protein n=1 Tax=Deinococcus seoulensis TaxID=1837379 RepID=A0ABQ2RSJ5_9DEIO|nr:hypothetical protein GCM10008959_19750 [Deinococcus seoulensis]